VINIKDEAYLKAFGMNLRKIRKEKGLSQEKLAYKADLSLSQIGRIERGEANPTICTVKIIAEALNESPYKLFIP
jgi:transcriptional regulator with XRE-family HTH domain